MTAAAGQQRRRIFINYRRDDSSGETGRIYDRLSAHFGANRVFMDIEAIEPGVDFVEQIEREVGNCGAVLVVIGRHWLDVRDGQGARRIDDPDDYVRLEILSALRRGDLRVIPVLVGGAEMPDADVLPEALAKLARRNAVEVSDSRFSFDVGRLIEVLERILGPASTPSNPTVDPVRPVPVAKAPTPSTPATSAAPPSPVRSTAATGTVRLPIGAAAAFHRCVAATRSFPDSRIEVCDEATRVLRFRVGRSITSSGEEVSIVLSPQGASATDVHITSAAAAGPAGVADVQRFAKKLVTSEPAAEQLAERANRQNVGRLIAWLESPASSGEAAPRVAPGWYPDPADRDGLRWWNGRSWTDRRARRTATNKPAAAPPGQRPAGASVPDGWYPDPTRGGYVRWWQGGRWTEHTQRAPNR